MAMRSVTLMIRNSIFPIFLLLIVAISVAGCKDHKSTTDKEQDSGGLGILTKVVSDPAGASVYMDGEYIDVTPLRTMRLSRGLLRIELEGYKTITTRTEDHAGSNSEVRLLEFDLEILPKGPKK